MTHHGNDSEHEQHDGTRDENEPVGGTLGTTGTEGYGMPEQVVGDALHTDERAQTAEESVTRGTIGGQVPGGLGTAGLGEDQLGGGLSPDGDEDPAEKQAPSPDDQFPGGVGPGADLGGDSAGIPGDQVTSDGGVSSDPLDGQNATGGYGDESTGLSDEATSDQPTSDAGPIDQDPNEEDLTESGGTAPR